MWVKYKNKVRYYRYNFHGKEWISKYSLWGHTIIGTFEVWEEEWQWRGKHYVKKPHHKKKTKTKKQVARDDWREKKQFSKDASKRKGWCRGFSKRWYKKYANKSHRQWERHNIHHENWDVLTMDYTKWTHDPWDIY